MSYIISTYFEEELWNKTGMDWVRKSKSAGLKGFIIGKNIPEEATVKSKELGFTIVPILLTYGDERDLFQTLLPLINKNQKCLFIDSKLTPSKDLAEDGDFTCNIDESIIAFDLVSPIKNLYNRAKVVRLLNEKIQDVYQGLLSSQSILGTWSFWNNFVAYQNYLHESNYIDKYDSYDLIFNLYIALYESLNKSGEQNG